MKATKDERLRDDEVFQLNMEFALLAERIQQGILRRTIRQRLLKNKFSICGKSPTSVDQSVSWK